jgi:hypothetical protein
MRRFWRRIVLTLAALAGVLVVAAAVEVVAWDRLVRQHRYSLLLMSEATDPYDYVRLVVFSGNVPASGHPSVIAGSIQLSEGDIAKLSLQLEPYQSSERAVSPTGVLHIVREFWDGFTTPGVVGYDIPLDRRAGVVDDLVRQLPPERTEARAKLQQLDHPVIN